MPRFCLFISVDGYGLFPSFGFMNNIVVWPGWWPQSAVDSAVSHIVQFPRQ